MAKTDDFTKDGQLKIVTLSGSDLKVQCSAINRGNGEDTSGLGWDRVGNTDRQRIAAADGMYNNNWRICVSIDKSTLRRLIKGPVIGVKLEVTPIQDRTCQPYNTQAVLTGKYYTAAVPNKLVELGWCNQGEIKSSSGAIRKGDISLNFGNIGTKAVFGNGNMVSAQTPCVAVNGSYVDATHNGTNPGTFYYLFSDSTSKPDFLWGRAASNTKISYSQPTQSLSAMFTKVMDSDDDDDRVCFYLTRYMHAYKSSYGYAGWIYADYQDSFKVHIVYQNTVDVTIPLYINNHDVGPDVSDLSFLWSPKSGTPSIKLRYMAPGADESTYLNYRPDTIYHLPYGSELSVLLDGHIAENMFSVSNDSTIRGDGGVYLDSSPVTLPLKLNLRAGVTFVDPNMNWSSYSTYAEIEGYFGQTCPLPLPPSSEDREWNGRVTHHSNTIYYDCDRLRVDSDTSIDNSYPRVYSIPDAYEVWKKDHKNDDTLKNEYISFVRDIIGVTYRNYKCEFRVNLPDGNTRTSYSDIFTIDPSEIGGTPSVVSSYLNNILVEYQGMRVTPKMMFVGNNYANESTPNWDNILYYASDAYLPDDNSPVIIVIEYTPVSLFPDIYYCYYKDGDGVLYRAIYYYNGNKYQMIIAKPTDLG